MKFHAEKEKEKEKEKENFRQDSDLFQELFF
jgi:hypothetical protein